MKLSADNVTAVFNRCLSEAGGTHVQADGVVTQAEFDPARLNEALPEIESMLDQLSEGKNCCRYLVLDKKGFECAKESDTLKIYEKRLKPKTASPMPGKHI